MVMCCYIWFGLRFRLLFDHIGNWFKLLFCYAFGSFDWGILSLAFQ